ncbi:hypothetical protein [Flammeovirga sp. OC4]|uniref:hypothetical protein n=1 Tax=Flammeovirga sp. OC4 TaxID=1382345 RepID=UPI0005C63641|nr:hypothetical protein [Flammeovirga sp. OC4]
MFYSRLFLIVILLLGAKRLIAQDFSTAKELKKYYKENCNQFKNPKDGWNEAWVILPSETEFITDLKGEVVNARVFVDDGTIQQVYYQGDSYGRHVYALGAMKKGKTTFQKVILDINDNLTEVYTAYTHTVIFKPKTSVVASPLKEMEKVGGITFFSKENKIEKHGFYVFVENTKTNDYDFLGFVNKKCKNATNCTPENSLQLQLGSKEYDIVSVQDRILFNRQMPTQKYSITVDSEHSETIELTTAKEN